MTYGKYTQELLDKLGMTLVTDGRMTTDELIAFLDCTVDDEGEIIDPDGYATGVWWDDLNYHDFIDNEEE